MTITAVGNLGSGGIYSPTDVATISFTPNQSLLVGDTVIILAAFDNTGTTTGASSEVVQATSGLLLSGDRQVWSKIDEYRISSGTAGDGAVVAVLSCQITVANQNTITVSRSGSVAAGAATAYLFRSAAGTKLVPLTASTQNTTSLTANPGSLTISGLTSGPTRLFLRATAIEINRDFGTNTVGFTNFGGGQAGSGSTGVSANGEFILTNATSATSNPSYGAASNYDSASSFIVFEEAVVLTGQSVSMPSSFTGIKAAKSLGLSASVLTTIQGTIGARVITTNTSNIGDSGFGASDYAAVPWAGSSAGTSSSAIIVGVMGMF